MMEKVKLKFCPFCRDHDVQLQYTGNLHNQVICLACGARGPLGGYDDAIERWNSYGGDSSSEVEK